MTDYRFSRHCPGPGWERRSALVHLTPDGQTIWRSYIWRRTPRYWLLECASLIITALLMGGAILSLIVWG